MGGHKDNPFNSRPDTSRRKIYRVSLELEKKYKYVQSDRLVRAAY